MGIENGKQELTDNEHGAVLLEYVFLLGFVMLNMLIWGNRFYNADNGLGVLGVAMQNAWQRIIECVSLPIP